MRTCTVVIAFLAAAIIPTAAASAERQQPEARPAPSIPLRNWIPAVAAHPPVANEGEIAPMALPSGASHFIAIAPCRVVDTRRPDGPHGGPIVTSGVARAFSIPTGPCAGIPAAAAYSLNVAVTGSSPGSAQFLTAYPAGTSRPTIATMNFNGGETVSNAALVPADGLGSLEIYVSTTSHVILDINGYVKEGVVTSVTPGSGLTGGGTGAVSLGVADGGVGATQLGASAVTSGAIADAAVTGPKIANGHLVRSVKGLTDAVDIVGTGGASVSAAGSTITVNAPAPPAGSVILGLPGDTTLIGAGYTDIGDSGLQVWRPTSTSGPSSRMLHTAVWTGTRMIVWGGYTGSTVNTGGVYDPVADDWTETSTGTNVPSARALHTAVWTGSEMIIWGGSADGAGSVVLNTGGLYDPASNSWTATSTFGAPDARAWHTAVWAESMGTMIVWGGRASSSSASVLNTGGQYVPTSGAWASTSLTDAPSARAFHTAVWTGSPQNKMIVWGGFSGVLENTGGVYDPAAGGAGSWTSVQVSSAPEARSLHVAVWTGTEMIVWGGFTSSGVVNTGGRYFLDVNTWVPTTIINAPPARHFSDNRAYAAVWTGSRMIFFGGSPTTNNVGGIYDPAAHGWSPMSTHGAPSGRVDHTCVWTGTHMLVFGGATPTFTNTGGRWNPLSYYAKN